MINSYSLLRGEYDRLLSSAFKFTKQPTYGWVPLEVTMASCNDWFVIIDGSDAPYIVRENEIEGCIDELREGFVDTVCQDLQDSLLKKHSLNSMVDAVIREYKDSPQLEDSRYWVTIYHVNSDVICKYNDYAKRECMSIIDKTNPTAEQIHDALCSVAKWNLLHFLKKEKCEFKSYYTPAIALMGGVNDLVENLIEVIR